MAPNSTLPARRKAQLVLVVDDSAAQRRLICTMLGKWGYVTINASSGEEALGICMDHPVDLIISDWMMPGITGPELCQAVRAIPQRPYFYFILLTSKSEKPDVAHGFLNGADDFLTKPVSSSDLLARIHAGERILAMEREMREKNRLVTKTLADISALYEALDRDLIQARQLQHSLLPERSKRIGSAHISVLLQSSGHVGGDFVSFVQTRKDELALIGLDVSGHGVASAMLTARLAGMFGSADPSRNVMLEVAPDGGRRMKQPENIARELNDLFFQDIQTEQYFTAMIGRANLSTGTIDFVQCGHPNLLLQSADGSIEFAGTGGLPIGLISGADWEAFQVRMSPGSRVLMASDGMTECPSESGAMLCESGLAQIVGRLGDLRGGKMLDALVWELSAFNGDRDFPDDVSGLLLEYH